MTPSNANTSGLEAKGVVWHNLHGQECIGWTLPKEYFRKEPQAPKPLVTAASAQAEIDGWVRWADEKLQEAQAETLKAMTERDAAEARADRLAKALEPFAAIAGAGDQRPKDDAVWAGQDGLRITYGDFRAARAALQQETQP